MGMAARRRQFERNTQRAAAQVADGAQVAGHRALVEAESEAKQRSRVVQDLRRVSVRRAVLEARQEMHVRRAREVGVTWATIGLALGVTPQAVQKRYGSPP